MLSDEQLLIELSRATGGLLFMSEADHPFTVVHWTELAEITPEHLREVTGSSAEAPVAARGLDQFFRASVAEPAWKGAGELAEARRYQALVNLLKENLEDIRVYRVGEINMAVVIIGRSKAGGGWIGLTTRIVET